MPPSERELSKRLADLFKQDLDEVAGQLPPQGSQVINRQTTRFRQTKGKPKKTYPLKLLIGERTAEGKYRFYIGGDRRTPTFIYESDVQIYGFNAGFVNTGKGLNDWIATFIVGTADTPETNQFVHIDGRTGETKTFSANYVTWLHWAGRDFWTTPNVTYCRTYHEDFPTSSLFHHQAILTLTKSVNYVGGGASLFKLYDSGFSLTSGIPVPPWMTWSNSFQNDGPGQILHFFYEDPDRPERSDLGIAQTLSISYAQHGVSGGEPLPSLPQTYIQDFTLHGNDETETDETQSWASNTNTYLTPQSTSAQFITYAPFRTREWETIEQTDGSLTLRWVGNPCAIPARSPQFINLEQTYTFIFDYEPGDRLTNFVSLKLWDARTERAIPLESDIRLPNAISFVGDTLYLLDYSAEGDRTKDRKLKLSKIKLSVGSTVTPSDPVNFEVPVLRIPRNTGIFRYSYYPV